MKRLGLVGVGVWGRRYIETVSRRNDCRIVAFARASPANDVDVPGAIRCESWRTMLQLVQRGDVDGIIVATTPDVQAEIAAAAALAGAPALVEKPLGLSRKAADNVLQSWRESERKPPIVVDYIHLFAPAYRGLKSAVLATSGGTAAIVDIESVGTNKGPFRNWSPLYDYGSHDVALCLDLLGANAPFRVHYARKLPTSAGLAGELVEASFDLDTVRVSVQLGNGAAAKSRRFAVTLAGGRTIVYDDCRPHPFKLVDRGEPIPVSERMPLDAALAYFLERIALWARGGGDDEHASASLGFAVRVAAILDAVAEAVGR